MAEAGRPLVDRKTATARGGWASGFTLIEMLLAIVLLAVAMTLAFMTFSTVSSAWQRGTAMVDGLHHGDFVMDQLCLALRSTYYMGSQGGSDIYGFTLDDQGDSPESADVISWVKLGGALIGQDCPFAGSPHRVKFTVESDAEGQRAAAVRAWRIQGQPDEFDPEELPPVFLSTRITGFNCRPAYPFRESMDEDIEWLDEWEHTNTIPRLLELTLYLTAPDEKDDAVEIKRLVEIPVAPLSLPAQPWPKE